VPRGIALAVSHFTMIRKLAFLGSVIAASVYLADKTRRDKAFGKARPMIDNVKSQLAKRGIGSNSDVHESDSSSHNLGSSGLGSSSAGTTTRRTPGVTSTSTTRGNGGSF